LRFLNVGSDRSSLNLNKNVIALKIPDLLKLTLEMRVEKGVIKQFHGFKALAVLNFFIA